jgi:phenylacetate-CoA ligase
MILQPELEAMALDERRALQSERLRELVSYVHERVPFYRMALDRSGVGPGDVESLEDLAKLPLTRKDDLREHYPFGLLAVPREETVRIHASSGTTGKLTVVAYTQEDLDLLGLVNARCLAMAGATPDMLLHNAYGYGLFTGGLGLHDGGERLGMTVVPVSGGMTERQLTLITDFRPQVIACTPSYALTLAHAFRDRGVSPGEISLEIAVLGAEPWTETMRSEIDALLGVRSTNLFGLSEVIGPGVSGECTEERDGLHVQEDHFLPEVVDRDTGEPLADGEDGVLVFTTLTKRALPLLRYWTGDVASLTREPCSCGRTLVRMSPIRGRADDMLIVRGVNLYPTQVEEVLGRVPDLTPHYALVVTRDGTLDEIEVQVEVTEAFFRTAGAEHLSGDVVEANEHLRALRNSAAGTIKDALGCTMAVTLMPPGSVPRSEGGKLARVVDRRRLD